MFDEKLDGQMDRLTAEHSRTLYRYYTILRELDQVEEALARMEAAGAELEHVKTAWDTQKAIDEAEANKQENDSD